MVTRRGFARLRAGRVAALACPRHAIHYRSLRIPKQDKNRETQMGLSIFGDA